MRVGESEAAVHQKDGNRYRNGRHHPGGEDEEEQVVLGGNRVAGEGVGGERAEENGEEGAAEADDQRVAEAFGVARGARDHHPALAHDALKPALIGGDLGTSVRGRARAGGEEVDVPLERRLKDDLRWVGDGVARGFEAGHHNPRQGEERDEGVETDEQAREPLGGAARFEDVVAVHRSFTFCRALT